jgi:hypothetical protein
MNAANSKHIHACLFTLPLMSEPADTTHTTPTDLTVVTTTTSGATPSMVSRNSKFHDIISKAIRKSHEAISIPEIIQQCYGEDASIFETEGDENDNLLVGLLDAALDKIDQELMGHVESVIGAQGADEKLNCLDEAISKVEEMEVKAQEMEEYDRQSAQDAIRLSRIPEGISIEDVMLYQAYLIHKDAREELKKSVVKYKEECQELEEKVNQERILVKERLEALDERNSKMSSAADLCSYNGAS